MQQHTCSYYALKCETRVRSHHTGHPTFTQWSQGLGCKAADGAEDATATHPPDMGESCLAQGEETWIKNTLETGVLIWVIFPSCHHGAAENCCYILQMSLKHTADRMRKPIKFKVSP